MYTWKRENQRARPEIERFRNDKGECDFRSQDRHYQNLVETGLPD